VDKWFSSAAGCIKCWRRRSLKRQLNDYLDGDTLGPDPADKDKDLAAKLAANRSVGMKRMRVVRIFDFLRNYEKRSLLGN